jgi:hypothetical protein
MTYEQAKREMDAAEERLTEARGNCTIATLKDYLRARRDFDRAARVAHDALWEDIQQRQLANAEGRSVCAS